MTLFTDCMKLQSRFKLIFVI